MVTLLFIFGYAILIAIITISPYIENNNYAKYWYISKANWKGTL